MKLFHPTLSFKERFINYVRNNFTVKIIDFLKKIFKVYSFPTEEILTNYAQVKKTVNFIQIGSNDGITWDPIHHHVINNNWNGLLVEPVNYIFQQLKQTYSQYNNRLQFANVAIAKEDGFKNIYIVDRQRNLKIPEIHTHLNSFKKKVILKHKEDIENYEDAIIEQNVPTMKFETLLNKFSIRDFDILQIDTEGYDFEILKTVDLNKYKPDIIMYEYTHLSIKDTFASFQYLKNYQYHLLHYERDIIGLSNDFLRDYKKEFKDIIQLTRMP